jgi:hypothetical protein
MPPRITGPVTNAASATSRTRPTTPPPQSDRTRPPNTASQKTIDHWNDRIVKITPRNAYSPSPTSCFVKRSRRRSFCHRSYRMNWSERGRRSGTWIRSESSQYPSSSSIGTRLRKITK